MAKKKAAPKAAPKATAAPKTGDIRIDPNLPMLPGSNVSFVADAPEGAITATVDDGRPFQPIRASVSGGQARVSKIIERPGDLTVTFYADGKKYATGKWSIG